MSSDDGRSEVNGDSEPGCCLMTAMFAGLGAFLFLCLSIAAGPTGIPIDVLNDWLQGFPMQSGQEYSRMAPGSKYLCLHNCLMLDPQAWMSIGILAGLIYLVAHGAMTWVLHDARVHQE